MPVELLANIRREMNYDHVRNDAHLEAIYADLPHDLRVELKCIVNQFSINNFSLFKKSGNKFFVSWVTNNLTPNQASPS